jgi:phage-related protein
LAGHRAIISTEALTVQGRSERWRKRHVPVHGQNCHGHPVAAQPQLDETVDAELSALAADMRARYVRIAELIEAVGLPNVREPHVKRVRGPIWKIRLKGKTGIARALYVTVRSQRVVVVRVFVKKTQKTPGSEIDLALQRSKEMET